MNVTTIVPINVGISGENVVQSMPYIPGNQIIITTLVTSQTLLLYTVPVQKRFLLAYANITSNITDGYSYIIIKNTYDETVIYMLYNITVSNLMYGVFSEHFSPMIELCEGYKIYGAVVGANAARYINIQGYLINTYGGY